MAEGPPLRQAVTPSSSDGGTTSQASRPARRQGLARRPRVHHQVGRERLHGADRLPVVAELAVVVVLDHDPAPLRERPAAGRRQRHAERELVGGREHDRVGVAGHGRLEGAALVKREQRRTPPLPGDDRRGARVAVLLDRDRARATAACSARLITSTPCANPEQITMFSPSCLATTPRVPTSGTAPARRARRAGHAGPPPRSRTPRRGRRRSPCAPPSATRRAGRRTGRAPPATGRSGDGRLSRPPPDRPPPAGPRLGATVVPDPPRAVSQPSAVSWV